ncbi:MAG: hypothetical protein CSB44_03300 [Gammaproteobacteria bacterium]|nr:MAG: hypothetical protein CSB44_03300 [Gammaproteobacteria bacterium]
MPDALPKSETGTLKTNADTTSGHGSVMSGTDENTDDSRFPVTLRQRLGIACLVVSVLTTVIAFLVPFLLSASWAVKIAVATAIYGVSSASWWVGLALLGPELMLRATILWQYCLRILK